MRVNVTSRAHQASPPPVPRCRGLRRSESAISFGATSNAVRVCGSAWPPPLRRSSTCSYLKRPETGPFCPSKVELLEPSILGIRPEPPSWPAREDLMREAIARRANCVELPLSLRIIKEKKKQQQHHHQYSNKYNKNNKGGGGPIGDEFVVGSAGNNSISKAFSCTVRVIRELQIHALELRALALEEEVGPIIADKMQAEVNSSFVWLFREVFSRTPDLMADVMVLMADFAAHSVEKLVLQAEEERPPSSGLDMDLGHLAPPRVPHQHQEAITSAHEKKLWDSMLQEASRLKWMEEDGSNIVHNFISAVRVEIQDDDDYDEYHRTGLLYEIGVYKEPHNPLLLCNYAQFLCLVTHNYDRAEECFERAVQVDPMDGEVLSQYATFLWTVRKNVWAAEERYQQAMAAEPENPYHASKYANFLWTTGGDDTCYPL